MPLWIFGYGSLLWHPGFEPADRVRARLAGYHRSFCMLSIHHRGTVEKPGLVLALDAVGASFCDGLALRVREGEEEAVLAYLRERELISSAYVETTVSLSLEDGRKIEAVAYVIDPDHEQYCQFDLEEQAHRIAGAVGGRGPNPEYLFNTADHLAELGIHDSDLAWLCGRVRELTGS
jgi:cation transport protein ChaC